MEDDLVVFCTEEGENAIFEKRPIKITKKPNEKKRRGMVLWLDCFIVFRESHFLLFQKMFRFQVRIYLLCMN